MARKLRVFADRSDKAVLFSLSGKYTVPTYIYIYKKYTVPWRIDGYHDFIQNSENIMQHINYAGSNFSYLYESNQVADYLAKLGQSL